MEKSSDDRKTFLDALEKTKTLKEVNKPRLHEESVCWLERIYSMFETNVISIVTGPHLRRLICWHLLCFDPRMQWSRLRKWRPSWQRRRGSVTTPRWLYGRSVSHVWRTRALNITPEHAAVALGWWDTRSDPRTLHKKRFSCSDIKAMWLISGPFCSWRTCWIGPIRSPSGSMGRRSTLWSRKDSGRRRNSPTSRRNTQRWLTVWTASFQTAWG